MFRTTTDSYSSHNSKRASLSSLLQSHTSRYDLSRNTTTEFPRKKTHNIELPHAPTGTPYRFLRLVGLWQRDDALQGDADSALDRLWTKKKVEVRQQ
ncbi:uncharacterized protein A4U43_C02F21020 [Asparagus officinalis]|uniref:Uncharacterized protein n=1 Tax=Asparagus officinalis TaxID=4686 RepID=A0A5P1FPS8_ASPOF|nr:uncharacterized protein A4U43_C02F21020 [Asparagus officinalis]